ncbi:MAG: hypothetical protein FWB78_12465 [Treponema sp.]|nr:hypothetical protein [Treponema sp.]
MLTGKTVVILLLLLYTTPCLFAFGGGGQQSVEVEVTGRMRLVGTSRFPSLVITSERRDWFISDEEREGLMGLQQRVVTVMAEKYTYKVFLANGLLSRRHYVLRNVVIVSVDDSEGP